MPSPFTTLVPNKHGRIQVNQPNAIGQSSLNEQYEFMQHINHFINSILFTQLYNDCKRPNIFLLANTLPTLASNSSATPTMLVILSICLRHLLIPIVSARCVVSRYLYRK
jgi:hypothetical protein